jgi:hypothetical protein
MARVALAYEQGPYSSAVCYSLKAMMEFLGADYHLFPLSELSAIPPEDLLVSYGRSVPDIRARKHLHIYRSNLLYESYMKSDSLPLTPLPRYGHLPVIYMGGKEGKPFLKKERSKLTTNIDIPASAFFMLTRYEEHIMRDRDELGRFPASSSLAFREGFLSYPIVNRYLDLFRTWVDDLGARLERRPRWRGREFAVCLTHDIDRIQKYTPRCVVGGVLRNALHGKLSAATHLVLDSLAVAWGIRQDPYWAFDFILNLEERFGMRSSFFVRTDYDGSSEQVYSILDARPSQLVKYISSRGHEIGLYGSVHSYRNPFRMVEERRRLSRLTGRDSLGVRQNYLLWENPVTWNAMVDAGLLYDSTLSFQGGDGFRCGACLPYRVFDIVRCRTLPLWEIPLTAMDINLRAGKSAGEEGEVLAEVEKFISTVRDLGGVFVLLWRSSLLETDSWRRAYAGVVEHIARQNSYAGTCSSILRCWTER